LAVLLASVALVAVAERSLRHRSGWMDPRGQSAARPVLGEHLLPENRFRQARTNWLIGQADSADTPARRVELLLEAADTVPDDDRTRRRALLERIVRQEGTSPGAWRADVRLIRLGLAEKPATDPTAEVQRLVQTIRREGTAAGGVEPDVIKKLATELKKAKRASLGEQLDGALNAAGASPQAGQ
jgi:hypothetical protein